MQRMVAKNVIQTAIVILSLLLIPGINCASNSSDGEETFPVSTTESRVGIDVTDLRYKWGDVRRYGSVGDGIADDTSALQGALDSGAELILIPTPPKMYMTNQLFVRSDSNILIEDGTTIRANAGYGKHDVVMYIRDVENVRISGYGATISMPKAEYSGEFRHGVSIRGSHNVEIEGLASNNTGGDGFYVGATRPPRTYSSNITLRDISADNNRRQGLSIVSARGIHVINARLTNTSGTSPASGIDIEPNDNSNFVENVIIDNPLTAGNKGNGISIYLKSLPGPEDKQVSITINNPVDEGSASSFKVGKLDTKEFNISGEIVFNIPVSRAPKAMAYVVRNYDVNGPKITFREPTSVNPNTAGHKSSKYGSAFLVYREPKDTGAKTLGNVHFLDPGIRIDRSAPGLAHFFHIRDLTGNPVRDVSIEGDIRGSGIKDSRRMVRFFGAGQIDDTGGLLTIHLKDRDLVINQSIYLSRITNRGSTKAVTAKLGTVPDGWPSLTFEVHAPNEFIIQPNDGASLLFPDGRRVPTIRSADPGATVTITRSSRSVWVVDSLEGNWGT